MVKTEEQRGKRERERTCVVRCETGQGHGVSEPFVECHYRVGR